MDRVFGRVILTLWCSIFLTTAASAEPLKEVYLKDGGIIECQRVWMTNSTVSVLVNRDTLVEFSKDEVDLKKTFARRPAKEAKKKAKVLKRGTGAQAAKPAATPAAGAQAPPKGAPAPAKPGAPAEAAKPGSPAPTPKPAAGPPPPQAPPPSAKVTPPSPPQKEPTGAKPPAQAATTAVKPPTITAATKASPPPRPPLRLAKTSSPAKAPPSRGQEAIAANGIYLLLLAIIIVVSLCRLFAKAGEAWWKALIPVYNLFVFVTIAGKPWWWGLLLFVPVVNIVAHFIVNISLARRFGQGALFGVGLALFGFVFYPLLAFGKSGFR
jgi:hypothetical protein